MRKHLMPEMREGGVNVTPLIDIIMCLIIFFMLVAKIGVDTGADRNIHIPASILGTDLKDELGNTLTLNVSSGPKDVQPPMPLVTALVKGEKSELKIVDSVSNSRPLRETLNYFHDGDRARNLPPNPNFKVVIRGDETMTYDFLAPVLVECAEAHVKNVAFVTRKATEQVVAP